MEIDLGLSVPKSVFTPREKFFYQFILDVLRSSTMPDSQAKSHAIANSAVYFCTSTDSRDESEYSMWQFWIVVGAIIPQVPHDHLWQDILADAVSGLRQRPEPIAKFGRDEKIWGDWEALPGLTMWMMDFRQDPFGAFEQPPAREKILEWQILTSFLARLTGAGCTMWMNWPAFGLDYTLGRPREKGIGFDCSLWIGTEWLLRSADAIYIALSEWEEDSELEERWKVLKQFGPALEKWQAWRQRLVELKENWDEWEFKDTTLERINQAIREMETVEQRQAKIEEEQSADKCADSVTRVAK